MAGSMSAGEDESDSDDEWRQEEEDAVTPPPKRAKSARTKKAVDYSAENQDEFFMDTKGYTSFGRTRKGGDRRPRGLNTVN